MVLWLFSMVLWLFSMVLWLWTGWRLLPQDTVISSRGPPNLSNTPDDYSSVNIEETFPPNRIALTKVHGTLHL
jgi:hypothetical protein